MPSFSIETGGARVMLSEDGNYSLPGVRPRSSFIRLLSLLNGASGNRTSSASTAFLLRLGGDSSDHSCWSGSGSGPDPAECAGWGGDITASDLAMLKRFAAEARDSFGVPVSFVVGTNLAVDDPTLEAGEVATAASAGLFNRSAEWPAVIEAVEVGNEVDSYISTHSSSNMSWLPAYEREFGRYSDAYRRAGMPAGALQGAVFATLFRPDYMLGLPGYLDKFKADLRSVSIHDYPTTNCHIKFNPQPQSTIPRLSSRLSSWAQAAAYKPFVREAAKRGLPFRIGEGNSASCGGKGNVSDALVAGLWAIDYLAEMSKAGVQTVNFHGGPGGAYAPVSYPNPPIAPHDPPRVKPLFYGMWLLAEAFAGSDVSWLETTVQRRGAFPLLGGGNSAAHCAVGDHHAGDDDDDHDAVASTTTTVRCVVVAKETKTAIEALPVTVTFHVAADLLMRSRTTSNSGGTDDDDDDDDGAYTATLRRLRAPGGLSAKTNLTYANQTLEGSPDGSVLGTRVLEPVQWASRTTNILEVGPVLVGPGSAVLVVVEKAGGQHHL